jgi:hypothetical protein
MPSSARRRNDHGLVSGRRRTRAPLHQFCLIDFVGRFDRHFSGLSLFDASTMENSVGSRWSNFNDFTRASATK